MIKNTIMRIRTLFVCAVLFPSIGLWAEDYNVTSPDGHLKATIHLTDGKLSYTVSSNDRIIVNESPLGLTTSSIDFTEGLELVTVENGTVDDAYTLPVGKRSQYRDHCNTLSVLTQKETWQLNILFRVYDDGFAFRYVIPK